MDFDMAKDILKNRYIDAGLELVDEHPTELFFKCTGRNTKVFRISQEEISEYLDCEQLRPTLQVLPVECSICSPIYREHLVDVSEYDRRHLYQLRDRVFTFGEPNSERLHAEIGFASSLFVNFFRFNDACFRLSEDRVQRLYLNRERNEDAVEMRDALYRPLTIRVYNIRAADVESALSLSTSIIDACLFELSYLKNLTLTLQEEWPRHQPKERPFQFGEHISGDQLQFTRVVYNPDIVRFYQHGMSAGDPVNQFLSFYHVLEYFFVTVADAQLYEKLSRRINDPKFSTSSTNLDRIIQDTLTHKRETDETEMLKLVLGKYLDTTELIEFIRAYEEYLDERIYTKKRSLFDETVEVVLDSGHVVSNIAKRVKIIRNALVHSSDRYDRKQIFVPTSDAEKMIRREVPLIQYIAEKVIIASARQP
jgi:hypothetical protein